MTDGLGADVVIAAVGVPAAFELAADLVRPGGRVANVGVHGKPATPASGEALDSQRHNYDGACRYVCHANAHPASRAGQLQTNSLVTHHVALDDIMTAYDTFERAAETGALKVVLEAPQSRPQRELGVAAGATS
jgi:alcohol dehydrogenase